MEISRTFELNFSVKTLLYEVYMIMSEKTLVFVHSLNMFLQLDFVLA